MGDGPSGRESALLARRVPPDERHAWPCARARCPGALSHRDHGPSRGGDGGRHRRHRRGRPRADRVSDPAALRLRSVRTAARGRVVDRDEARCRHGSWWVGLGNPAHRPDGWPRALSCRARLTGRRGLRLDRDAVDHANATSSAVRLVGDIRAPVGFGATGNRCGCDRAHRSAGRLASSPACGAAPHRGLRSVRHLPLGVSRDGSRQVCDADVAGDGVARGVCGNDRGARGARGEWRDGRCRPLVRASCGHCLRARGAPRISCDRGDGPESRRGPWCTDVRAFLDASAARGRVADGDPGAGGPAEAQPRMARSSEVLA